MPKREWCSQKATKSLCSKDQGVCPRESGFIASNVDAVGSCYLASPLWYAYKRMRSAVQEMTTQSTVDRTMHETRRKGPGINKQETAAPTIEKVG
jgi:hypothetical protein